MDQMITVAAAIIIGIAIFANEKPKQALLHLLSFFAGWFIGSLWLSVLIQWTVNILSGVMELLSFTAENQSSHSALVASIISLALMAWIMTKIKLESAGKLILWSMIGFITSMFTTLIEGYI